MKTNKIECSECDNQEGSIFCQLETQALQEISDHKIMNRYKKGQTLFHEGNPPYGLYCISSGKIKLTKTSQEGKDSIIRIVSPGDVLGHRSLFSNDNYRATATALEDCDVCFIDKKFIQKQIDKNPTIALELIAQLTKAMGVVEDKVASFYQKNVRERLAALLIEFYEKFGTTEGDKTKLDIRLTREEMASIVGVATETLIRFMTEFKEEGAISQQGKTIYVDDLAKLRELGNIF
jgi:CRP-like cAMP-binding protein